MFGNRDVETTVAINRRNGEGNDDNSEDLVRELEAFAGVLGCC